MKFERGEVIELKGAETYNAKKGDKAICKGYFLYNEEEFIDIEWVRDGDSDGQLNGGYYESMFIKSEEVSE